MLLNNGPPFLDANQLDPCRPMHIALIRMHTALMSMHTAVQCIPPSKSHRIDEICQQIIRLTPTTSHSVLACTQPSPACVPPAARCPEPIPNSPVPSKGVDGELGSGGGRQALGAAKGCGQGRQACTRGQRALANPLKARQHSGRGHASARPSAPLHRQAGRTCSMVAGRFVGMRGAGKI